MRKRKEDVATALEAPGATLQSEAWGGMAVAYTRLAKGTDFAPALEGLDGDMCPCPHWGYVVKGALHFRYADGSEEVARAGDLWYAPPGHTAWCEEDTEFFDVSPAQELEQVLDHVRTGGQGRAD
jgi:hypothetical protein